MGYQNRFKELMCPKTTWHGGDRGRITIRHPIAHDHDPRPLHAPPPPTHLGELLVLLVVRRVLPRRLRLCLHLRVGPHELGVALLPRPCPHAAELVIRVVILRWKLVRVRRVLHWILPEVVRRWSVVLILVGWPVLVVRILLRLVRVVRVTRVLHVRHVVLVLVRTALVMVVLLLLVLAPILPSLWD